MSLPQWIVIGETKDGVIHKVNFNSLKRDGNKVGFTSSMSDGKTTSASFLWVDCSSWQYVLANLQDTWSPIPADSVMDSTATFVCKNSTPNRAGVASNQAKVARGTPTPKGIRGKCTFYSNSGGRSIRNDSCIIDRKGSTTTLYWSDNVFTRIKTNGSQVEVFNPDGSPFAGRTIAKSSIGITIEYEKGTIGWCWNC